MIQDGGWRNRWGAAQWYDDKGKMTLVGRTSLPRMYNDRNERN